MFGELLMSALLALSALFFVVDPIGVVPIFVAMTEGDSRAKRAATARKACFIFVGVVSLFAVGGGLVFRLLGVSLAAFKIAGGILLMLTALDMLRGKRPARRTSAEELDEATQKQDVAVVPLAMPLMAGPGAIATVMVLTSRAANVWDIAVVLLAIVITGVASFFILGAAHLVDRVLGMNGRSILERIMGLVLAAIAVQFVVDGVGEALPGVALPRPPALEQSLPLELGPSAHTGLPAWYTGRTSRRRGAPMEAAEHLQTDGERGRAGEGAAEVEVPPASDAVPRRGGAAVPVRRVEGRAVAGPPEGGVGDGGGRPPARAGRADTGPGGAGLVHSGRGPAGHTS